MPNISAEPTNSLKVKNGKKCWFFSKCNSHSQICAGILGEHVCSHQAAVSVLPSRLKRISKKRSPRSFHTTYSCPTENFVGFYLSSASLASCSTPAYSFSSQSSTIIHSPPLSQESGSNLATPTLEPVRPQPRIQVASLLAPSNTRSYYLQIVQQPVSTAEFGTMYLSRLPLTPPVIARLIVRDSSGNSIIPETELPFLVAHLSLYSGDGTESLDTGSFIGNRSQRDPPMLYGHLVSTVEQLEDLQGNMGLFFLFPDVSIRSRGRYQLGVSLMRITSSDTTGLLSDHGALVAQARTRPFDALPRGEYVATPPTRLTLSFIRQGARVFLNSR